MRPTSKRRRLLIATAAMAMLAVAWWRLSRPQVDPRLVGTWDVTPPRPRPDSYYTKPIARSLLTLRSDGTAVSWTAIVEEPETGQQCSWSYDDNILVLREQGPASHLPPAIVALYEKALNRRLPGRSLGPDPVVISMEPQAIRVRYRHIPNRIFIWTRWPPESP